MRKRHSFVEKMEGVNYISPTTRRLFSDTHHSSMDGSIMCRTRHDFNAGKDERFTGLILRPMI
jgi:hypothetical protein